MILSTKHSVPLGSETKATDSDLYLPSWVRQDPETLLKGKTNIKRKKKRRRKCNMYTLRGILDDRAMQKFEEASWLSNLINRRLNGVLSRKIKLRAVKKSVYKELGEYDNESDDSESIEDEKFHSPKTKINSIKNQKQKTERKLLFRDRLIWERMNEWKKRPPLEKAETVYSQNFITYLGQVKLPGKRENINELEYLYKTYQQIVVPKQFSQQPEPMLRRKRIHLKSMKRLITTAKGDTMENTKKSKKMDRTVSNMSDTSIEETSSESSEEVKKPQNERRSQFNTSRMNSIAATRYLRPLDFAVAKQKSADMNIPSIHKKENTLSGYQTNSLEEKNKLKKKLSLTTVFKKKATLNSLTSIKNPSAIGYQRKATVNNLIKKPKLLPKRKITFKKPFNKENVVSTLSTKERSILEVNSKSKEELSERQINEVGSLSPKESTNEFFTNLRINTIPKGKSKKENKYKKHIDNYIKKIQIK